MRQALFRFDASPAIGAGHAVRCLALARALVAAGWACRFMVGAGTTATVPALAASGMVVDERDTAAGEAAWLAEAPAADLVVVDHYRLAAAAERRWRGRSGRILVIDDLADRPHDCDLLLDQTYLRDAADYAGLVPAGCRLLLGPDYALLRPEFAEQRPLALARRRLADRVERVLIAPGGTDPTDLATPLLAAALALGDVAVDLAIGGAAPHLDRLRRAAPHEPRLALHVDAADMAALMTRADLCLGAAGGTAWERCCLGLPSVLAVASADQHGVAAALAAAGAAEPVAIVDPAALAAAVRRLAGDAARRWAMSTAAAALCDGGGAGRVAALLG